MASNKVTNASVSLTLPISCQICLGKVREPVVCPNQHVFCSPCLDLWLRSNRFCPTCRTPINQDQPCKKILGSIDLQINSDTITRVELRRTRLELIRQEYEDDIIALQNTIERLKVENKRLHERLSEQDKTISALHLSASQRVREGDGGTKLVCSDIDMLLKLTAKLQEASTTYEQLRDDMSKTKEENRKLRDDNETLIRQTTRYKDDLLFTKSPQRFGRYTMTAMQTKVSQYEKEVQQLKKALTRSDQCIEELNAKLEGRTPDGSVKKDGRIGDSQRKTAPTATVTSLSSTGEVPETATSSSSRRSSCVSLEGINQGGTSQNGVPLRGDLTSPDILENQELGEDDRPTMVSVCSFPNTSTSLNSYSQSTSTDLISSTLSEAANALEAADQWLKASPNKPGTPTDRRTPDVFFTSDNCLSRSDTKISSKCEPADPFPASRQLMMLSERLTRQRDPAKLKLDFSAPSPVSSDGGKSVPRTLDFDVLVEGSLNDDSPQCGTPRLETLSPRVECSTADLSSVSAAASYVMAKIKTELEDPDSNGARQAKKVKLEKDGLFKFGVE